MLDSSLSAQYQPLLAQFSERCMHRSLRELEALSAQEIKALVCQTKLPSLIIPKEYGGLGVPLADALDVIHGVAKTCPSAALMLCMHFHVISTIAMYPEAFAFSEPLLTDIAQNNKLMASAFAESGASQDIFDTSVAAKQLDNCIEINGDKKPCTMSSIADYYAVSVITEFSVPGIAIIKEGSKGIASNPFWPGDVLGATDSNQVVFQNTLVSNDWVVFAEDESFEVYLNSGLVNFNLLIGSAYTGVAQALSERLNEQVRQAPAIFVPLTGMLAQCRYSVRGLGDKVTPQNLEWLVPTTLCLRYQIQKTLKEAKNLIFESAGVHKYLSDDELQYLARVVDLLSFHPVTKYVFEQQLAAQ